jgi:hypothetical protein
MAQSPAVVAIRRVVAPDKPEIALYPSTLRWHLLDGLAVTTARLMQAT